MQKQDGKYWFHNYLFKPHDSTMLQQYQNKLAWYYQHTSLINNL